MTKKAGNCSRDGFAHKVVTRPVVREVPTQSRMLDKVGTHHERRFNIPFVLSDSLSVIYSSRLLYSVKVVGTPKAFGGLFRLVGPRIRTPKTKSTISGPACPDTSGTSHREERDESSESLSKGNLPITGTYCAKLSVTGVYTYSVVEATVVSGQWLGYRS